MSIKSFADQTAADVAAGLNSKAARLVPQRVWTAARRKLDMLAAAESTRDLSALPGNRFEALTKTRPGFYSVRVNDQYRIIFRFEGGHAYDVFLEGYDHTGRR